MISLVDFITESTGYEDKFFKKYLGIEDAIEAAINASIDGDEDIEVLKNNEESDRLDELHDRISEFTDEKFPNKFKDYYQDEHFGEAVQFVAEKF